MDHGSTKLKRWILTLTCFTLKTFLFILICFIVNLKCEQDWLMQRLEILIALVSHFGSGQSIYRV